MDDYMDNALNADRLYDPFEKWAEEETDYSSKDRTDLDLDDE